MQPQSALAGGPHWQKTKQSLSCERWQKQGCVAPHLMSTTGQANQTQALDLLDPDLLDTVPMHLCAEKNEVTMQAKPT